MNKHATALLVFVVAGAMAANYGAPAEKDAANRAAVNQLGSSPGSGITGELPVVCPVKHQLQCEADCRGLCPAQDLGDMISAYFGPSATNFNDPPGLPSGVPSNGLQYIIATVPDPVHTHLSLFFDRSVEAIEEAVDRSNYVFAAATTPWENQQHAESTNFLTRRGEEIYQQAKESFPGLLIFRRQQEKGPEESLFVFLVAEVPTEGINKEQFHNALRAIHLIGWRDNPPAQDFRLRVIGPTFSGSLYSLNEILTRDAEAKAFPRRTVFSFTVSSSPTIDWFRRQSAGGLTQFPVLRQNDDQVMSQFIPYATKQLGESRSHIALLSEDETAYGSFGRRVKNTDPPAGILEVQFPRDIAALRAAYQRQLREERIAEGTGKRPPRTSLPLNLEDTGSDDDSIATFSHTQTPGSEDKVLSGIVSRLRANRVRLIVLRATSALDRLFLTQYLRTAYPQGRIVITGADRLFQSNAEGASMRGVLALTAIPLWTGEARHDQSRDPNAEDADPRPIIFPSEDAEEVYDPTRDALEYPDQSKHALNALWLSVVGRDGYWPIARLPRNPGEKLFTIEPTVSWKFLFLTAVLLAGIYIGCTWRGSIRSNSGGMVAFAPVKDVTRSWILCIFAWILLVALLLVVLPCDSFTSSRGWALGGWFTVAMLVGSCFLDLRRRESRSGEDLRRTWVAFWFVGVSVVMIGIFASRTKLDNIFIYRYVHASVGVSPIVPLLLLAASGLWWAWYSLKGLVFLDSRRPRLPATKGLHAESNASFARLSEDANARLVGVARPLTRDLRVYIPTLGGALITLLFLWRIGDLRLVESLEQSSFDFVYEVALGLALLALTVSLAQLALTWIECRSLLRSLDRLPLRRAFKGLKEFSWRPIWQLSAGGLNDLNTIFTREMESLIHLHNTRGLAAAQGLTASLKTANSRLDRMRKSFGKLMGKEKQRKVLAPVRLLNEIWTGRYRDETQKIANFEELRLRVASVCGEALRFLSSRWEEERGLVLLEAPGAEAEPEAYPRDRLSEEVKVTEQFVCLVYVNFIFMILRQIRNLLTIVAGLFVFVVLSLSSYPYVPTATIRSVMLLLFLALAGVAAVVYSQMHTDSTLSRVTGTSAGKLGGDFWLRLGSAVGLPLIGLLAYQFPQVNNLFFSWLQPALQALK